MTATSEIALCKSGCHCAATSESATLIPRHHRNGTIQVRDRIEAHNKPTVDLNKTSSILASRKGLPSDTNFCNGVTTF